MKLLAILASSGVLAGALGGCGGSSSSSSSRVDTGLNEATALRDVTSAESISACQNLRAAIERELGVDQAVRKACELFGAALTDDPAACGTQADSCVTQTNEGTNPLFQRESLDFAAALRCDGDITAYADCDVTVAEFEGCMDARLDQAEELFSSVSCAAAATIGTSDAMAFVAELGNRPAPAACERLIAECPRAEPFSDLPE